jgi:hypothetical protein
MFEAFQQDQDDLPFQRLNTEWAFCVALRETLATAYGYTPTYRAIYNISDKIFPTLMGSENSLLAKEYQSKIVREYIQEAEAANKLDDTHVTAISLLEKDIAKNQRYILPNQENDAIRQKIGRLRAAHEELLQIRQSENELIFRDALEIERDFPVSGRGRNYVEFQLPKNRRLRVRVLHPDKPEHLMGADVIYENYSESNSLVRFVTLQYKMWEGKSLIVDSRSQKQIEKLSKFFCEADFCIEKTRPNQNSSSFRFPYCSSFLRPTDRLQSAAGKHLSSGYHVPICKVLKDFSQNNRRSIPISDLENQTVNQDIFENLFNLNMIGSDYITYQELENLYKNSGILDSSQKITIHAQEIR